MLIVDDEPNVCYTLKLIFEQEGFAVTTAPSAAEAIRVMKAAQRFDVVITDLHMEREDAGFDLARVAKKAGSASGCCGGDRLREREERAHRTGRAGSIILRLSPLKLLNFWKR